MASSSTASDLQVQEGLEPRSTVITNSSPVSSASSPSDLQVQELLKWFHANGGRLHQSVEIHWFDDFGGWGFKAKEDIGVLGKDHTPSQSNEIVSCPYQVSLSYLNAWDPSTTKNGDSPSINFTPGGSPHFPSSFFKLLATVDDETVIIGNFFLMQQYLLGEKSFWYPYIQLLPQPDQPERLGTVYVWPDDDLNFLRGTNAEPAITARKAIWKAAWQHGVDGLKGMYDNWEAYTYDLYEWAAAVFGTRSFRPSLVLPNRHTDDFSVLLPVLDLGNHKYQPSNVVSWYANEASKCIDFHYNGTILAKEQIFNNYGLKSNSELLLGYGFMLPEHLNEDTVNLKLTPNEKACSLRRAQQCYTPDPKIILEAVTYQIHTNPLKRNDERPDYLRVFSDGFIDTLVAMLANTYEDHFLRGNPTLCPEKMGPTNPHRRILSRNFMQLLFVLCQKLDSELSRHHTSGSELAKPINYNQNLATEFRNRQTEVIRKARALLFTQIESIIRDSSLSLGDCSTTARIFSLEQAFHWLSTQYPRVFEVVEDVIASDQEEERPLDWFVLIDADWGHTLWSFWLYIVWFIREVDVDEFDKRHKVMGSWIGSLSIKYNTLAPHPLTFTGESQEESTFNTMINELDNTTLPISNISDRQKVAAIVSWLSEEEKVVIEYPMFSGSKSSEMVMQRCFVVGGGLVEDGTGVEL